MEQFIDWFIKNKEWLLGGVAVSIPLAIIGWLINKRGHIQTQKSGHSSVNIQAGRDVDLNRRDGNE
jgi:hypothetical protein